MLVYTAAYTGLRAGELGALRREDLDLLRGTLTVDEALKEINSSADSLGGDKGLIFGPTKTHATRTISLPRFLCELLAEHLPPNGDPRALVFTTPTGRPLRHNLFYKRVFKPTIVGTPTTPTRRIGVCSPSQPGCTGCASTSCGTPAPRC